ncbi:MAG TPA: trigger factor [Candidatus Polarisedimenticolia bacterium]|nr:trigger factor [Candidatus Polarisedimenticolia bacterium]
MSTEDTARETDGLKIAITELGPARKSLSVEVAVDQVDQEYAKACRKYMRNLKVPGFRQGKVPPQIIKQRFGREIEQETVEHVIEHALGRAVAGAGLKPLRAPILKEYRHTRGEPLSFTAEIEVRPAVTLKGVRDIRVAAAEPNVTDRMVSEALDAMRERAARFEPVEGRGLRPGDHALIDVKARFEPEGGEAFAREQVLLEIGSGGPHPELTEPMRDMMPGQTREFGVSYPDQHPERELAGRRLAYHVVVREIKQKLLPDLDDEFARDLGRFDSLEELRRRVSEDLLERERRRVREDARGTVIEQLLALHPEVPAPEVMVEDELDRRVDELVRGMVMQGVDPRRASVDWGEFREKQRDAAGRAVRAMILLDAVADEEKISLEPEAVDRALADEAARRRLTTEALRAKLAKDGRLERLEEQLLREKVLDFVLAASNT